MLGITPFQLLRTGDEIPTHVQVKKSIQTNTRLTPGSSLPHCITRTLNNVLETVTSECAERKPGT